MGKVYLGDECIGEMYTQNIVDITTTVINVPKKPVPRYWVDESGIAKTIEGDITSAFDDVVTIGYGDLYYAFYGCKGLTGSVSFPNLTSIDDEGLERAFYDCTGLTGSVSFPKLTSVGLYGLRYAFYGCKGLTGSVSFPNLTSVEAYGLYYAFDDCEGLTEIHFRADAQATIEAQGSYSSKFGATNATIYFDL